MSKTPFLFPLRAGDIACFCHPDPTHDLAQPHFIDGDLSAGNGYLAIKATRGLWLESDFTPAPYEAKERISNLPWHNVPEADHPEWRKLDDIRGILYQYGSIHPWTDKHKPTPSPVWRVAQQHLIRLSHLQLIARLPAAQIYCGHLTATSPAFVRFNGGSLIIPLNRSLQAYSRDIFAPSYDVFTGERKTRYVPPKTSYVPKPIPEPAIEDWPPTDTTEL
jgi:hypothetical protein